MTKLIKTLVLYCSFFFTTSLQANVLKLNLGSGFTESQATMCYRVEGLYNKLIGTRGLPQPFDEMNVSVVIVPIDGRPDAPNIWAQSSGGTWRGNAQNKYVMDGAGKIEIDEANLPFWTDAVLSQVIFHECAHFFGFNDYIWYANGCLPGLVVNTETWPPSWTHDGKYLGTAGLAAYQAERNAAATWLPVVDSHLDQILQPWMMTPALSGAYVSRTFLMILQDNGNTPSKWGDGFMGGELAVILPRRPLREPPVIVTP